MDVVIRTSLASWNCTCIFHIWSTRIIHFRNSYWTIATNTFYIRNMSIRTFRCLKNWTFFWSIIYSVPSCWCCTRPVISISPSTTDLPPTLSYTYQVHWPAVYKLPDVEDVVWVEEEVVVEELLDDELPSDVVEVVVLWL